MMRRGLTALWTVALLIVAPATAQPAGPVAARDAAVVLPDGSELWFVQMSGPPILEAGSLVTIMAEQRAFHRNAEAAGVRYRERRAFQTLWNGVAIAVRRDELGRLRRLPGVAALHPVLEVGLPEEPAITAPQMISALSQTGADYVQHTLGFTGAGIRVGVIDTGIDYDHPDLGGDGQPRSGSARFPNARVVAGWDFVGDGNGGAPVPDPFPDDCYGHGTHVAGIIAGRGVMTGVAPDALLGAYRIFGCGGTTTTDLILAALERAHTDGMDVVNLSIGTPFVWPEYPTAVAADRLARNGVVVVAAQGNNGSSGLYAANAPGTGRDVITVASFQNTSINLPGFRTTPENRATTFFHCPGSPAPPVSGTFTLERTGTRTSPVDLCEPLVSGGPAGKVALVRAGGCNPRQKCLNAERAGALAVVLYSNLDGFFRPDVSGEPAIGIPVIAITRADGERLDLELGPGPVSLTWAVASFPNPAGALISNFSSYGPAPDLSFKPNLGAPGGFVLSAWPLEAGGYLNDSGTSMATPQVAGAAALLLQARPGTPPDQVRARLESTARPRPWSGDLGRLDAVHRQGAGMLDIAAAIQATTTVEPDHLELGESEAGPATRRLTIRNHGPAATTYTLEHESAIATGPDPFILGFHTEAGRVTFDRSTVTLRPGGMAHLRVTIAPGDALPDGSLYGGYLVLRPVGAGRELRVPYLGFKGDYQSLPTLAPTGAGFPWLARMVDGFPVQQPAGASFTLSGDDVPWIVYHLAHQAEELIMEVSDATTGRPWHRMQTLEHVPRSTFGASFFADPWDGYTQAGRGRIFTVPDGSYLLKVSALRALGDRSNPDHWDTWTSPPITIARHAAMQTEYAMTGEGLAPAPTELALAPILPNPTTGPATLAFRLPQAGPVALDVFDIAGRRLKSWRWENLAAGAHAVQWDGSGEAGIRATPGVAWVRLAAGGRIVTRRMLRVR